MIRRNDDPPDDESVYEFKIADVWFAWDENLDLWAHVPDKSERDDGYILIRRVDPSEFEAPMDDPRDEAAAIARAWLDQNGARAGGAS